MNQVGTRCGAFGLTGRSALRSSLIVLLVVLGTGAVLRAADEPVPPPDPAPPPGRLTREEIRERFKNLTPEERTARLEALRDKGGPGAPLADAVLKRRGELQKLRDEIKDLPAGQQQARIREWRATNSFSRPLATMSPEEREAVRKRFEKRIEEHIATLNKKKADGSLTEEESRRLRNMERLHQRLQSGPNRVEAGTNFPLGLPPPAVKPSTPDDSVKSK